MALLSMMQDRVESPVDVIEQIASSQSWPFEREDRDEITIVITGKWCDYHVSFAWLDEVEALHLTCGFDLKVPERRKSEIDQLITRINARMWVGHFDHWTSESAVMFRHSLLLTDGMEPSSSQCEQLIRIAVETCERHYQAFQFVVWAGKSATEALDTAMFETAGEA